MKGAINETFANSVLDLEPLAVKLLISGSRDCDVTILTFKTGYRLTSKDQI